MNLDPKRLHLMAEHFEGLAADCRALEVDAARGQALLADTIQNPESFCTCPDELADIGRRMVDGRLLTSPNLLIWRNLGRRHQSVRRSKG